MDRRKFIKILGAAGVASALPVKFNPLKGLKGLEANRAYAIQYSPPLQKFMPSQYLPMVPGSTNPYQFAAGVADPVSQFAFSAGVGADLYRLTVREFTQQLHPSLPKATKLWGYCNTADTAGQTHLGGLIIATKGKPVRIRLTNELPPQHILPVDITIPGANYNAGYAQNRTAIHLHGGFIPWTFDGGPFDYFTPASAPGFPYASGSSFLNGPANAATGSGFLNDFYTANGYPGEVMVEGQADYYYPNDQGYRLMWYHDHAIGITRLNAYAGIASGYLILDPVMINMMGNGMLPPIDFSPTTGPTNNRFIPLVFQDKTFIPVPTPSTPADPGQVGEPGDLWYPSVYDGGPPVGGVGPFSYPPNVPSCVPEFFGDTMLVNGIVYPVLNVQPRKYRFCALNACNARFLRLKLVLADASGTEPQNGYGDPGTPTAPAVGPPFVQIANEAGFLAAPATFTGKTWANTMLLAPAERAEFIVDFSKLPVGTKLLLYNDATAPFPGGGGDTDFYPGNPLTPQSVAGFGPNTRTLMQITVVPRIGAADRYRALVLPALQGSNLQATPQRTRVLSLNEGFDEFGRLIQLIGGTSPNPNPDLAFGVPYVDSAFGSPDAERIPEGDVEVWQIANLTGDTHPMHFHLQDVQIKSRRPFNPAAFPTITYLGPARPPDANENGFKETVRMNPNEVVEVIAKWDLAALPTGFPAIPDSPRTGGKEYVWHCHILEHEEHDMMHALVIDPPTII